MKRFAVLALVLSALLAAAAPSGPAPHAGPASPLPRGLHEEEHHDSEDHYPVEHFPEEGAEETTEEEYAPEISFAEDTDLEHMRNFQAISGDLKAYENEYLDCIQQIDDADFSEDRVDQCVGHNFIKVLVDIKYVSMKTMSQGDSKVRTIFVEHCYPEAFGDEEYLAGCDVMERDVLNMLWTGLSFVDILEINSDKYLYEYGKVPAATWGVIMDQLTRFSAEFFELIDEIDSHKEVTILRLKNYIEDRIRLIAESQEEGGEIVEPPTVTHTLEVEEQTELTPERRRKLLPAFQIGNGNHGSTSQNRYVNAMAVAKEANKKIYDKPQTAGVYMFDRLNAQRKAQAAHAVRTEQGRQAFKSIDFGRFKAK